MHQIMVDSGYTLIHDAASNGHLEIIKFLVNFTNTPNAPSNFGDTPSSLVRANGHTKVVDFLENYIARIEPTSS